ncbi:protein NLRC3-like isoform X2 [Rhinatrema bivittatum]|uniref:protein NLRC3-like isoform X2 n=1 Tax=Rhinatrema bivittatum TaxID=194408 RepID=UPI00112E013E|nr:protein NLRC3-like isoform X2 [Rhinatrema bivittatum]
MADEILCGQVQAAGTHKPNRSKSFHLCLLSVLVILITATVFICKWKKKPMNHRDKDEVKLLESDFLNDALELYRNTVNKTTVPCYKLATDGKKETDDCLNRTLYLLNEKSMCIANNIFMNKSETTIQTEDLFTEPNMNLKSRRMLLVGDAGMGKSCLCKKLLQKWAAGVKKLLYKCIIYITFSELNSIKQSMSVRKLLESKCQELSSILTDLLNTKDVLIILDGLDDFKYDVKDTQSSGNCDIDTPLDTEILIANIIEKKLLGKTDILLTSRLDSVSNIRKHFKHTFIMHGFTNDQIHQYYEKFSLNKATADIIYQMIKEQELLCLVSFPFLSSILCDTLVNSSREQGCKKYKGKLATFSKIVVSLLQNCLRNILSNENKNYSTVLNIEDQEREKITGIIHQVTEISYRNLIHGVEIMMRKDLEDKSFLKEFLSEHLLKARSDDNFEYRHANIRDMFAALHCVWEIQGEEELIECLNAWVFGEIPPHPKNTSLLQGITAEHKSKFKNFIRFFMGLLTYQSVDSLFSDPPSLSSDIRQSLCSWFQNWIEKSCTGTSLLNLCHCIFELHDAPLTKDLSSCFKTVNLLNTPLDSVDIRALKYSLETSKLEKADLRLCKLRNEGLEQLQTIITNCRNVMVSSNNLTKESGRTLAHILQDPYCGIESLSLGTNKLETAGVKHLWKALEQNHSLQFLYLYDNDITDESTASMAESLTKNTILQKLHLCGNTFGDLGIRNIELLKQQRRDLQIVLHIPEDKELFSELQEWIQSLADFWPQFDIQWLRQFLDIVQKDLDHADSLKAVSIEKVNQLNRDITELKKKI